MAMSEPQMREASAATLVVISEREFAVRRHNEGARVIQHRGRYWEQMGAPGFFQPVNLLARLTPEEATWPTPLSWGYRAALTPESADAANGKVPIVRVPDLKGYEMGRLSSNRRNKLRKCQRLVQIVQLTGPELLLEHGYELVLDSLSRTRHRPPPSREEYVREVMNYFRGNHWCVLAGLIDGRLGGYLDVCAVEGVVFGRSAYYATWALSTNISTGLSYEMAQLCRRNGNVHTLVVGLHVPEDPRLGQFKDDMGFAVDHIPIKWDMNPLARAFIRWRRPHAYYRLTGIQ